MNMNNNMFFNDGRYEQQEFCSFVCFRKTQSFQLFLTRELHDSSAYWKASLLLLESTVVQPYCQASQRKGCNACGVKSKAPFDPKENLIQRNEC